MRGMLRCFAQGLTEGRRTLTLKATGRREEMGTKLVVVSDCRSVPSTLDTERAYGY